MWTPAILSAVLFVAAPPPAQAAPRKQGPSHLYFEQISSQTVEGRAEGSVRVRVWCAGERLRMEAEDGSVVILRLDRGRAYRLDPGTRTARSYPAAALRDASRAEVDEAGIDLGAGQALVTPQPLGRTKTVAGHRCRGYRFSLGQADLEVYVAPDLPSGVDAFRAFMEWSGADRTMPGFVAALRRLPGLPLETRARFRVEGTVRETVARISVVRVGPLRPELFEPPPGYRLVSEGEEEGREPPR